MVLKKVLEMVLTKYYNLQTLQNATIFQFICRSIKSQVAGPKAGPAGGRAGGLDWKRLGKNASFIENSCFKSILIIFGPSRRQKWIRLEISVLKMVKLCLET